MVMVANHHHWLKQWGFLEAITALVEGSKLPEPGQRIFFWQKTKTKFPEHIFPNSISCRICDIKCVGTSGNQAW
jgi:hypothetical protein